MTATQLRPEDTAALPVPTAAGRVEAPTPSRPRPELGSKLRVACGALALAAILLLGFVGYLFGVSGLSEARTQQNSFKSFQKALGEATAAVGPTRVGAPVAVLDIARIGLHHVVVFEGTDARTMTSGPGHRRDTPLPGQAGVSVIFGRRATFGAPFAKLLDLRPGDTIEVTTGQGVSDYVVSSFGTSTQPAPANSANRIVLTTADSDFEPGSTQSVSADLRTPAQPAVGARPAIATDEQALDGAAGRSLLPLALWAQALVVLAVVATVAVHRWSRWPAWICFAAPILAVLWNIYENAATLLPNVL